MAVGEVIQLRYSTNAAGVPNTADETTAHLKAGEPAVTVAVGVTKVWVGDTASSNRLLLSTEDTDAPLLTAKYLKLAGGTLSGPIKTTGVPTGADADQWLVNKAYVDGAVASGQQRVGAYNAATNIPALNPPTPTPTNGQFWDVSVSGTSPAGMPGVTTGTALNAGAKLVWNTALTPTPGFDVIPGGGITQQDADNRYVMLAGSTLPAGATITLTAPYTPTGLQVATAAYVGTEVGAVSTALTNLAAGSVAFTPIVGPPAIAGTTVQAAIAELNTAALRTVNVDANQFSGNGAAIPIKIIKISGGTY